MMNENQLMEQLAQWLNLTYPKLLYHFDLSGMFTSSHKARNLYGRLNARGWPDLLIYEARSGFVGLALELKRQGTVIYKKNGSLRASVHLTEQQAMLDELSKRGWSAHFGVGFDETTALIHTYMN